jgi:hypothetical protein
MNVRFPRTEAHYHGDWRDRGVVGFDAEVDGQPVNCEISIEALANLARDPPPDWPDPRRVFNDHRTRIEGIARRLIEAGRVGADRRLAITSGPG